MSSNNIVDNSCNCAHCLMNTFLSVSPETLKAANVIPDKLKNASNNNNTVPDWITTFQNTIGSDSIPSNIEEEELKQAGSTTTEYTNKETPAWLTTFRNRIL